MAPLLLLLLAAPPVADDLAEFAAWCAKHNLKGMRDQAYDALLRFQPEDEAARKALGYRWDKEQLRWTRKDYKQPKDRDGPRLAEARERWRVLTHKHADAVLDDPDLKGAERTRAIDRALALAPDHARARAANGEIRRGDAWILAESGSARERARAIDALARKALDGVRAPTEGPVTQEDGKLGIAFPRAWVAASWRALGTVDDAECKDLLKLCEAAFPFLDAVYELRAAAPRGFSLYLLKGGAAEALGKHPAFSAAERKFALSLDGTWIPGSFSFVCWSDRPLWRRDVVVRAVFGLYLRHRFDLGAAQGWAWEGFGSYLTYQLAGTRLAVTAQRGPYAQDATARAKQERGAEFQKTDWCAIVARRYEEDRKPDLAVLVGKDVNTMTADDALVSFALAEYLTTAFPKQTAAFLKAYGGGASVEDAMTAHLGFDLKVLERRFVRWLRER